MALLAWPHLAGALAPPNCIPTLERDASPATALPARPPRVSCVLRASCMRPQATADTVRLEHFWCPRWICLRKAHPLAAAAARGAGSLPPPLRFDAAALMRIARHCGCTPCDDDDAVGSAGDALGIRREWRCAHGCEFEQTLADGASVPGWCPACIEHGEGLLRDLSKGAASRGGQCVSLQRAQLRWHRDSSSHVRVQCRSAHHQAFVITVEQLKGVTATRGPWCPACVEEERAAANAAASSSSSANPATQAAHDASARQAVQEAAARAVAAAQAGSAGPSRVGGAPSGSARQSAAAGLGRAQKRPAPPRSAEEMEAERQYHAREQQRLFEQAARAQQARRRQQEQQQQQQQQQQATPPWPTAQTAGLLLEMDVAQLAVHVLSLQAWPWHCLGLPPHTDADAVRKQYKALALRLHPDKTDIPTAQGAFDAITKSFKTIYTPPAGT